MSEPFKASWDGGYFEVSLDPEEDEIVWWGADHPKGGHPYDARQPMTAFLAHGGGWLEGPPPPEALAALRVAVEGHLACPPPRTPERALALAAKHGDAAAVQRLLAAGVDPNAIGANDLSALEAAILCGYPAIAITLLEAGARPRASAPSTPPQRSPASLLRAAMMNRAFDLAEALLRAGVRLDADSGPHPVWATAINTGAPVALLRAMAAAGACFDGRHAAFARPSAHARFAEDAAFAAWVTETIGALPPTPHLR